MMKLFYQYLRSIDVYIKQRVNKLHVNSAKKFTYKLIVIKVWNVVGPVCESADFLNKSANLKSNVSGMFT